MGKNADKVLRKEIKYRISLVQYSRLEQILSRELKKDAYSEAHGSYTVRSLYLDSIHD